MRTTVGTIIKNRRLITVADTVTVVEAARVMVKSKVGAVPIRNQNGRIIGIFTERDLLKRVVAADLDPKITPITIVMTRRLVTVPEDVTPTYCLRRMQEKKFRHMLIANEMEIIGIVSQRELIEYDLRNKTSALQALDA
jgi:CBS domain-containing protein